MSDEAQIAEGSVPAGEGATGSPEAAAAVVKAGEEAARVDPEHADELRDLAKQASQQVGEGDQGAAAHTVEAARNEHPQTEVVEE